MIALEDAQARLLALADPVEIEAVPIAHAVGRWLAESVTALRKQPARDLSAMDGYAIAAGYPGPWRIVGESAAGKAFESEIAAGEAVRIFTGAVPPEGADSVIIQENVTQDGGVLRQSDGTAPRTCDHVRRAGSDFSAGEVLIGAGELITPARLALAIMAGYGSVRVRTRVGVTLISTGDELMPPGTATRDDQIPSSNGPMLSAMLASLPVTIRDAGIVPDTIDAVRKALRDSAGADVIVTIGGASVGDHDLVRPALLAEAADLDFWKVAMRPGKPVMVGRLGGSIVLGLPGNPVSAYVTAILFLKPLIAALSGARRPLPSRESAILDDALPANGPRIDHLRARVEQGRARLAGANDSAALKALAQSNALIVRPVDAPAAKPGDIVDIIRTA